MSTQDILAINPRHGFSSRRAFEDYVKREIKRAGEIPAKAQYDSAGNCTTCGEAGRCPGYHTQDDKP